MKESLKNLFVRKVSGMALSKARCVKNVKGYYANNHSGFAFKYREDLSNLLRNTCLDVSRLEPNIVPVFVNYHKQCCTPYEAITQKIGVLGNDMDSLLGHLEWEEKSILFAASGLSNIYQNENAGKIWCELHPMISGYYNTVILTDTHPDFLKLIEAERDWEYIQEKYGKVLPDLNDTKITHINLDKMEE